MLLLISYIGGMDDKRSTFLYSHYGTHMVPQLQALGIQYEILKDDVDLEVKIKNAVRMMQGLKQPVALLFTGEFTI
jgi:hypothetical protein